MAGPYGEGSRPQPQAHEQVERHAEGGHYMTDVGGTNALAEQDAQHAAATALSDGLSARGLPVRMQGGESKSRGGAVVKRPPMQRHTGKHIGKKCACTLCSCKLYVTDKTHGLKCTKCRRANGCPPAFAPPPPETGGDMLVSTESSHKSDTRYTRTGPDETTV